MEKYITENCALYNGDCLEVMDMLIEKGIKVDAIITDPPFGSTCCAWDSVIPFDKMWIRLNKLIKDNGAIVLFGKEPFSSKLRCSNLDMFKYDWIWKKDTKSNFMQVNYQPLNNLEVISIFSKAYAREIKDKIKMKYNPQFSIGDLYKIPKDSKTTTIFSKNHKNGKYIHKERDTSKRYPFNILEFNSVRGKERLHPTQKPIELMEYLIKTYTNEDDLVLDFTMGSGSTCVAARNTNRKVIGIELEKEYFDIAVSRYKNKETLKDTKKEENIEDGLMLASWKKV